MKYLKKFEAYSADPAVKPAPVKPGTKPGTRPSRPSPIRRDRPSVEPKPKAGDGDKEKNRLKKRYKPLIATAEDVVQRYNDEIGVSEATLNPGPRPGSYLGDPKMPLPNFVSKENKALSNLSNRFRNEDWYHSVALNGQRDQYKLVLYSNRLLSDNEISSIPEKIDGFDVIVNQSKNIK